MKTVSAVIPAAGVGKRFGGEVKKQFFQINGKPVLYYTLFSLRNAYPFAEYVLGLGEGDEDAARAVCAELGLENVRYVQGGAERFHTVYNCICAAASDFVAVHDAVRPFVTEAVVRDVVESAFTHGGAICGLYARDTVKQVVDGKIQKTLPREQVFLAHTPQVFRRDNLRAAMEHVFATSAFVTDEASAMELAGYEVFVSPSTEENIKLTFINDIGQLDMLAKKYFVR